MYGVYAQFEEREKEKTLMTRIKRGKRQKGEKLGSCMKIGTYICHEWGPETTKTSFVKTSRRGIKCT